MSTLWRTETELDTTYPDDDCQVIEVRRSTYLKHRHSIHSRKLVHVEPVQTLSRDQAWVAIGSLSAILLAGGPADPEGSLDNEHFPYVTTRAAAADLIGRLAQALV